MTRLGQICVVFAVLVCGAHGAATEAADRLPSPRLARQLRRPVALVATERFLFIANSRSGTISLLDRASCQLVAEHTVAQRIADMIGVESGSTLLVLDDAAGCLLRVRLDQTELEVDRIADVPSGGCRLAAAKNRVFVSAKWSHAVLALTCDAAFESVSRSETIELPFAPRELLLVNDAQNLLAADAFGGRIAVIDTSRSRLQTVRTLAGHNIRGLAVSANGAELLVAHQQMTRAPRTDYEEVHWGRMLANAVQVLALSDVLAGEGGPLAPGWLDAHGDIGAATADPARIVTGPQGLVAVTLAGVGQVAVRRGGYAKRLPVGPGPEAMAAIDDQLFIANRFDDTISIVDLPPGQVTQTVSLGPQPEPTAVDRGEQLFYDARLSHDGWMSCHSCHTDGHSSGLLVDTLGDGDYGAPKRVPSLLGTGDTGPWAWDGSVRSLSLQVRKSVTTTMHGEPLDDRQTADLVAYLESLPAPPTRHRVEPHLIEQGRAVFEARNCVDCHAGPALTTDGAFNVGLVDERSRTNFNPPSLRGVSHRSSLFHDGRSSSLADLVLQQRHQLKEPLPEAEAEALLSYLRSL